MCRKRIFISSIILGLSTFFIPSVFGQVGIGTVDPNPNAILDVSTDQKPGGLLIPRVSLNNAIALYPSGGQHVEGMIVYNTNTGGSGFNIVTPGFYYNNGDRWVRVTGDISKGWNLTGNAGTDPEENFLGTTNNAALRIRTNNEEVFEFTAGNSSNRGRLRAFHDGSAERPTYSWAANHKMGMFKTGNNLAFSTNQLERIRITNAGRVIINDSVPISNSFLSVYGTGNSGAIIGINAGSGDAVVGEATGTGHGVVGKADHSSGAGVLATNAHERGTGLIAVGNGIETISRWSRGSGVAASGKDGIFSVGRGVTGNGIITIGNGLNEYFLYSQGSGIAATGDDNGIYATAISPAPGSSGGIFILGPDDLTRAEAIISGYDYVDEGEGNEATYFGGYFRGGIGNDAPYAYVGISYNGTEYKILGNGTVSGLLRNGVDTPRVMYASEAPEILLEDVGSSQLINGEVYIELDPVLKHSLYITDEYPLKVFITLEGECNGIYVTDKSKDGFRVVELNNGRSNAPFSWQIVANRADTVDKNGNVLSKNVGVRMPVGPKPLKTKTKKFEVEEIEQTSITDQEPKTLEKAGLKTNQISQQ